MKDNPRFLADSMLIRLARWLRVLDCDTLCYPEKSDAEVVGIADAEQRWLLTRDRALVSELRPDWPLLIRSSSPLEQLREVVEVCQLRKPVALFQRCMMCNTPLRAASEREIIDMAPKQSRRYNDLFLFCPGCERIYWPGSHTQRMEATLRRTLPEWFDAGSCSEGG